MSTAASAFPANPDDIAYLGVAELTDAFKRRALSPVAVADALIERIGCLDPRVNAIVHVDPGYTRLMARASEARYAVGSPLSPLDGVPLTVKDLSRVAGMPFRRGCAAMDPDRLATEDTPCVARLREAGAVFIAKTATPDAGCKVVTRSTVHGVTANPYDLGRTPGGSSGGAAAALALGFGPLAVGSDGAGSLRIPACSTNTFALKPGFGRIPTLPHGADMPLSVVGPMARTVGDAAAMLAVMCRLDPRDPYAWPVPFAMPADLADPDLLGLRVAVSPRLGCSAPLVDAEVDGLVTEAAPLLAGAGASVEAADPVWPADPLMPFQILWEAACADTVNQFPLERQALLDPLILSLARRARTRGATDIYAAIDQRIQITVAAKAFFNRFDLLVGPVMPVPPYAIDRDVPEGFGEEDWSWCPYTYPWNMTGQPAASVPIGFTRAGLPVGVQIVGRFGGEADVLRAAAAIEVRRPLHRRRPALP